MNTSVTLQNITYNIDYENYEKLQHLRLYLKSEATLKITKTNDEIIVILKQYTNIASTIIDIIYEYCHDILKITLYMQANHIYINFDHIADGKIVRLRLAKCLLCTIYKCSFVTITFSDSLVSERQQIMFSSSLTDFFNKYMHVYYGKVAYFPNNITDDSTVNLESIINNTPCEYSASFSVFYKEFYYNRELMYLIFDVIDHDLLLKVILITKLLLSNIN